MHAYRVSVVLWRTVREKWRTVLLNTQKNGVFAFPHTVQPWGVDGLLEHVRHEEFRPEMIPGASGLRFECRLFFSLLVV
jgi:hypothetical protein